MGVSENLVERMGSPPSRVPSFMEVVGSPPEAFLSTQLLKKPSNIRRIVRRLLLTIGLSLSIYHDLYAITAC